MSFGYRQRHTKLELIPCLTFLIIIGVAGFIIIDSGLAGDGGGEEETKYDLRIELYSTAYEDLAGELLISENDVTYESLNTTIANLVFSAKAYKGTYTLYYYGDTNGVEFGPVTFTVSVSGLVLDQIFLDVRITIHALG